MIKPQALVLGVVMAAISAGTFYGLTFLPADKMPSWLQRQHADELKAAANAPAPGQQPRVETPVATAKPAESGAENTPGPGASAPPASPPPAAEPAKPAEVAKAEETKPAEQPQQQPQEQPKEQPKAAEPPPPPAEKTEAAPEPAPAPKPKPKKKAAKKAPPESTPPSGAASAKEEPGPAEPAREAPPNAEAMKQWWPDPSKMPANQLKLMYAGQVKGEKAMALLFSSALDPTTLNKSIQVVDESGKPVNGSWAVGNNPRLAVMKGLSNGRYTVILKPTVADSQGFMLGTSLEGPVYIQ